MRCPSDKPGNRARDDVEHKVEPEPKLADLRIGSEEGEAARNQASYDPAGAQRRIASGDANSHFDWDKTKMDPERMEEELAKLPSESDRKAIRSMLESRERSEKE